MDNIPQNFLDKPYRQLIGSFIHPKNEYKLVLYSPFEMISINLKMKPPRYALYLKPG